MRLPFRTHFASHRPGMKWGSGVNTHLCRHSPTARGVQRTTEDFGNDENALIGLHASRHRPQDIVTVVYVNILIHGDGQLELVVKAEETHERLSRLPLGGLVKREIAVVAHAGVGDVDLANLWHRFSESCEQVRLFGHLHQGEVICGVARDEVEVDRTASAPEAP